MNIQEAFGKIRPILQQRAENTLARGTNVREDFRVQLNRFFDAEVQAIVTGDVTWLNPILKEWASTKTETDLAGGEINATNVINQLVLLSTETIHEGLEPTDALDLICALTPIFIHSSEQVISFENESRVAYISSELGNLQAILKRLDISKSAFVSVAAHEFKTPLTLVEGYAAMLDELVSADSEQMRPLLLGIHNGISRLRDLVDDMIDISLLDNNIMKFNFQPMRLIRMLNFLNNDFQPALTKRKQTLDIRQFNGADEMLYFDSKRIYQALSNIISNAIKFTPDCGKITIDGRIMPGFIELTIADTGIGISIENQDSIFEKFGQLGSPSLHSSGKTKFKGGGPGLGLPIAKGIIQGHGGSIWVESDDYDEIRCPGSIFHILLPLSPLTGHPNLVELPKKPKPSSKRPPKLKK